MSQSVILEHFTITPENLAKQGASGQKGVNNNYDKSPFHLPRQSIIKWLKRSKIGLLNNL